MRRRRRTRGTWFPTIGTAINSQIPDEVLNGRAFNIPVQSDANGGVINTIITPLTFDRPFEGDTANQALDSLSDIVGSEYVLQRIVGKLFIERQGNLDQTTDQDPAVLVGAGFFVARANDADVGGGDGTPIGSATQPERRDNYSPLEADVIRDPWIWRRVWVLGSSIWPPQTTLVNDGRSARNYPPSTAHYGSVADGPHIDAKSKRRVGQDDRLWFAVSTTTYPPGAVNPAVDQTVRGYLDYRIYGSLRKPRGRSAF